MQHPAEVPAGPPQGKGVLPSCSSLLLPEQLSQRHGSLSQSFFWLPTEEGEGSLTSFPRWLEQPLSAAFPLPVGNRFYDTR